MARISALWGELKQELFGSWARIILSISSIISIACLVQSCILVILGDIGHDRGTYGDVVDWHFATVFAHVGANIASAIAFLAFPVIFLLLTTKRKFESSPAIDLTCAFLFTSGIGELMRVLLVWHPVFWYAITVDILSALVAIMAVYVLIVEFISRYNRLAVAAKAIWDYADEAENLPDDIKKELKSLAKILGRLSNG